MGSLLGVVAEETPSHVILKKGTGYEIRRYAACYVAETPTTNLQSSGDDGAFRRLAGYIGVFSTPANEGQQKISMTSPVITCPSASSSTTVMQFVLPSKLSAPPASTDPMTSVQALPERVLAAATFSGSVTPELVASQEASLRKALAGDGVMVPENAALYLMRYNPPWTLAWLRTNEVLIPVTLPVTAGAVF